ncbi:MAG: lipoyl(octanoyl) transferase LipB [Bdellovibrionota bacterium]
MEIKFLNLISYGDALGIMEQLHKEVVTHSNHKGYLLVLQHPPTVTMGKRELLTDMKIAPEELKFKGVAYYKIDRGGSVTVHEPGQIVIYPIIQIDAYKHTVRSFVAALEQAMIDTCAHYHVRANRDEINPGVWVGENKIGAVGIRVLNKVTKHGLAFNITNSLSTFSYIVPCGLRGRGVINLQTCLSADASHSRTDESEFFNEVEKFLTQRVSENILRGNGEEIKQSL